jgi:hypothetical protein
MGVTGVVARRFPVSDERIRRGTRAGATLQEST